MNASRREFLLGGGAILAGAGLVGDPARAGSAEAPPAESVLRLAWALPADARGERRLAPPAVLVLTNASAADVRIWKEWCSWGYYALSLEWREGEGDWTTVRKAERGWRKNFPDYYVLEPDESAVYEARFDRPEWSGFPAGAAEGRRLSLRASFALEPDADSAKAGVWTGRILAPPVEVLLAPWG